jgi:hypothetical protein
MDFKNLSERELINLLEHQKRILFLVTQPAYGFEKYSSQTIQSLINEALDNILLIQTELERRKHEKDNQ